MTPFQKFYELIMALDRCGLAGPTLWEALSREGYAALLGTADSLIGRYRARRVLDPDDVVHIALVNLTVRFRKGERFGKFNVSAGRLACYLCRSVFREMRTVILRALKKRAREATAGIRHDEPRDHRWSPADDAELVHLINDLPDPQRALAALLWLEGATPDRAQTELGISRTIFYQRLKAIRERFEGYVKVAD